MLSLFCSLVFRINAIIDDFQRERSNFRMFSFKHLHCRIQCVYRWWGAAV